MAAAPLAGRVQLAAVMVGLVMDLMVVRQQAVLLLMVQSVAMVVTLMQTMPMLC